MGRKISFLHQIDIPIVYKTDRQVKLILSQPDWIKGLAWSGLAIDYTKFKLIYKVSITQTRIQVARTMDFQRCRRFGTPRLDFSTATGNLCTIYCTRTRSKSLYYLPKYALACKAPLSFVLAGQPVNYRVCQQNSMGHSVFQAVSHETFPSTTYSKSGPIILGPAHICRAV